MLSPVHAGGPSINYHITKWMSVDTLLYKFLLAGRDLLRDFQGRESIRQHAPQPEDVSDGLDISLSMHVHGRSSAAPPR